MRNISISLHNRALPLSYSIHNPILNIESGNYLRVTRIPLDRLFSVSSKPNLFKSVFTHEDESRFFFNRSFCLRISPANVTFLTKRIPFTFWYYSDITIHGLKDLYQILIQKHTTIFLSKAKNHRFSSVGYKFSTSFRFRLPLPCISFTASTCFRNENLFYSLCISWSRVRIGFLTRIL